jgi:hypothetical protein
MGGIVMTKEQLHSRIAELELANNRLMAERDAHKFHSEQTDQRYTGIMKDSDMWRRTAEDLTSKVTMLESDRAALIAITGRAIVTSGTR